MSEHLDRSVARIELADLRRLAELAADAEAELFGRNPQGSGRYAGRLLGRALCQGAAVHYVDGRNGVKDFDVWSFYAELDGWPFPPRWRGTRDFGPSKFDRYPGDPARYSGRRVDCLGRSLPAALGADPAEAIRRYLAGRRTESARQLAAKAVILIDPRGRTGEIVWPSGARLDRPAHPPGGGATARVAFTRRSAPGASVPACRAATNLRELNRLCKWSPWMSFGEEALACAPRDPGVYMAREGRGGPIVYVGHAGERRGQGIRGRLKFYASGKGLTSGLGEAVADRALADPAWLRQRLAEATDGSPRRAIEWGREAFLRADLYVRWATTADKASASALERHGGAVCPELWNRNPFTR